MKEMNIHIQFAVSIFVLLLSLVSALPLYATTFSVENGSHTLIGNIERVLSNHEDTLLDIARRNGLGYQDIKLANPKIDTWLPGDGAEIVLPTQFILPHGYSRGIVLNIPEMRLYYFPDGDDKKVVTYPLGIGREGWSTPYVKTRIIQKNKNPSWYPPKSIRQEHEANGDPLPKIVKPGPDNPLGDYALRLGLPGYLIHGTNKPFGIGMRVSHGCIRLYPEHVESLFSQVKLRTPVNIINQPYKIGQRDEKIYLEAHPFLEEDTEQFEDNLTSVVKMLVRITEDRAYEIDWDLAKQVIRNRHGIPVKIGQFKAPEETVEEIPGEPGQLQLKLETELPASD